MGLLLFLQPFLVTVKEIEKHAKKNDYLEVIIGKSQMEVEMKDLTFEKVEDNTLIFRDKKDSRVIYEQYKQMIRKTSSTSGHQPILTGIEKVTFSEADHVIEMEVRTLEKETYLYYFFPKK